RPTSRLSSPSIPTPAARPPNISQTSQRNSRFRAVRIPSLAPVQRLGDLPRRAVLRRVDLRPRTRAFPGGPPPGRAGRALLHRLGAADLDRRGPRWRRVPRVGGPPRRVGGVAPT